MKLLASGAMVALLLGLAAGWVERPRAAAAAVMQAPRLVVDTAADGATGP